MKIYIPLWLNNPHALPNPFVYTYTDEILKKHKDVLFKFDLDLLWKKECMTFDIVHFMWPHCFDDTVKDLSVFEKRLNEIKANGIKIIATCHNLQSHAEDGKKKSPLYDIVYGLCDVIIHLGQYSNDLLQHKYKHARHVIIPHHVYNTVYPNVMERNESINYLGLSSRFLYILCMGEFRNREEREMVLHIANKLKKENIRILAPSIMTFPYGHKNPKKWLKALWQWYNYRINGIIAKGKYISDNAVPYYYGSADIALIQRVDILNSGNVPLAFFMGKVVVGPNVGNVGLLLRETGNPVFEPHNDESIISAIQKGFALVGTGKGKNNRNYCETYLTTSMIADQYWIIYKESYEAN